MKITKQIFALLFLGAVANANAEVVEFNLASMGYVNKQNILEIKSGDVTITTSKGGRNLSPQYYSNYNGVVFYGSNYMTVNCAEKAIEKIELKAVEILPMDADKLYAEQGFWTVNDNATEAVWANNRPVSELVVTPRSNTIELGTCITSIRVHLTERPAAQNVAATPRVSPEGGQIFYDTPVYLSTGSADAQIYYTTDGSIPEKGKAGTKLYEGPFYLSESSTVCAITEAAGLTTSSIGSRNLAVPIEVNSIAQLLSQAREGVYYTLDCDMLVTYRLGSTCWVVDDTDAISLFGDAITNKRPESGYSINSITGRFNLNNQNPELEYVNESRFTAYPDVPCEPYQMSVSEINGDWINHYIIVKDAAVTPLGDYNYRMTDATGSITIRNNYRVAIDESILDGPVDVKLFPTRYNSEMRYYIAEISDPDAETPEGPDTPSDEPHDGTSATRAYTVAEATSLGVENFTSNTWVKGYIVGSYPDMGNMFLDPTFGTANATTHGLALADDADCTVPSACIKLINLQGSTKTDLNLADNPEMLGRYVAVAGMLGSNYSVMMMPNQYTILAPPTAAIDSVEADEELPVRYFNIQGIEVTDLRPGTIYIRTQGTKAVKIMVK